ncbi:uncharacterized protein L969DRAFT_44856 [Mixia osmundae IAM 14324]|uniref:HIT domain-containing protein n=1 Tax=Mixia osmundae (strain CBS 9802 / IAM 14324 / JCM 22182 / KY 12970) TaxID=764103 RepID=G7DXF1_MIXOS|nr:uncharacterized protein L969DRAFT_44856 [Mixia osmundae IAM 14324]KEI41245.1 hypothetical protein L969DRAFT_44856 [Mixia osmundae IAM 14324]GAA95261.1 hypothetical protein E5Q_01917 [Mixia osmundae IAM 14324]
MIVCGSGAIRDERHSELRDCIFCGIRAEKGFTIVYESGFFVVIEDRSPAATTHLLCIPKTHIPHVKILKRSDLAMLAEMKSIAVRLLEERGYAPTEQSLGFHTPPIYSVNHLHLHVLGLPFRSRFQRFAFSPAWRADGGKGFAWFSTIDQVIRIISAGKQVRIRSVRLPASGDSESIRAML